jgi:hypothetical protein
MTMKNKINLGVIATLTLLTMMMSGCSFSVGTTPETAKANTNAAPANKPASNTASNTAAAPQKADAKPKLESEKKPEGKATKAKDVPVPADWIYMYDEAKGYGFSLPAGSTGGSETTDGVDVFVASTPSEIGILVFSFKDAKLSKEDLLDTAEKTLKEMGQTVQAGKLTGDSEDYSVAEATMTDDKTGAKSKAKVLVGTDVTDNYVMIVGTEEAKYAANQKIIDEIWGSFEMWSGGSSGNN